MPVLREGTNPIWGAFMLVWLLGWIGVDFYWLFTESGPVRWLAEVQASLLGGSWIPKLTLLLLILAQLFVLRVIKLAIETVTGRKLAPPVEPRR